MTLTGRRIIYDYTHKIPLHDVHTKDPIVISTYVGPLWWQSKHCLLCGKATISRNILRCFSSCFLLFDAIFLSIPVIGEYIRILTNDLKGHHSTLFIYVKILPDPSIIYVSIC